MNKMHTIIAAAAALTLAACDAHIETPDMTVRPGHVLCDDGTALSYAQYKASGKQAVAVVFDTGQHDGTEGNGYAVYLWDIAPQAFADSLGVEQGTSADTEAFDGNENTFALYDTQETASPMAAAVFDLWCYGQSAYIPSVAQMRLLYAARETVNPVLELCGGGHSACRQQRRLLVLDFDGSRGTADRQGVALLDRQRSHAGNSEDTGAQGASHYHIKQIKIQLYGNIGHHYAYRTGADDNVTCHPLPMCTGKIPPPADERTCGHTPFYPRQP